MTVQEIADEVRRDWQAKVTDLEQQLAAAAVERDRLQAERDKALRNLAECYRLTGADPDDNDDWRLAGHAIQEVARLRDEEKAEHYRAEAAESSLTALRQQMQGLVAEMRVIASVAGQCSVEGPPDAKSSMAAAEAERCSRWADALDASLTTHAGEQKS